MPLPKIPTWLFFACAAVLSSIGAFMATAAFSAASLHFGRCGPSSLSAPEQYCRGASQLLIAGYGVLLASIAFAGVALLLRIKRRGVK
jgi:hypothetical protein